MKRTGFTGYVYNFSVDYGTTSVDDIKDIHKYLMKKNNMIWYMSKTIFTNQHIKNVCIY